MLSNVADLYVPYLMLYGNIRQAEPESVISCEEQTRAAIMSGEDTLVKINRIVSVMIYIACVVDGIVIVQMCINQRRAMQNVMAN